MCAKVILRSLCGIGAWCKVSVLVLLGVVVFDVGARRLAVGQTGAAEPQALCRICVEKAPAMVLWER